MAPFGCAGHCSVTGAALQCSCAGRETASHSLCPSTPALSLSPAGRSGLSLPGPGRRICPRLYAGLEPSFALSQRLFPAPGGKKGFALLTAVVKISTRALASSDILPPLLWILVLCFGELLLPESIALQLQHCDHTGHGLCFPTCRRIFCGW